MSGKRELFYKGGYKVQKYRTRAPKLYLVQQELEGTLKSHGAQWSSLRGQSLEGW